MKVLIYADLENSLVNNYEKKIWATLHKVKTLTVAHSMPALLNEVRHPMCRYSVLLFFPSNKGDLREVLKHEELFDGMQRIAIVPNGNLMPLAEKLRPKFLCQTEQDCKHTLDLLDKMSDAVPHHRVH